MASALHLNGRPSINLQTEWLRLIAETGQPELIPALNHGPVPKDAKFAKLLPVHINRKKRPNQDKAPCPMCTKNRFLHGSLVYLYEYGVCTVIGHCCADYADEAERHYKAERLFQWQEEYLLQALPHVADKRKRIIVLKAFAEELQRVYRKIKNEAPILQAHLRQLKDRNNARLSLFEADNDNVARDYVGPAGFRGSASKRGAREVTFGVLRGTTLLIRDYKPVTELNDVERNLAVLDFAGKENEIVDFIAGLSAKDRMVAVELLKIADARFAKFQARAFDALQFLDPENIANLNKFGAHPLNTVPFGIELKRGQRTCSLSIQSPNGRCLITIRHSLLDQSFSWTAVPYRPLKEYLDGNV